LYVLLIVAVMSGRFWAVWILGCVTITAAAWPVGILLRRADRRDPIDSTDWDRRWTFRWAMLMAVAPIVIGLGLILTVVILT
jgi:hypothetical protein